MLNSSIYKITNTNNDKIYIGSTSRTLKSQFINIKSDYKAWKKDKIGHFKSSFSILEDHGIENCEISLLVGYCGYDSLIELNQEKSYYIKNNNCYNKSLSESIETKKKKRYKKHICDCGGKYSNVHKSRHMKTIKHQKFQLLMEQINTIINTHL